MRPVDHPDPREAVRLRPDPDVIITGREWNELTLKEGYQKLERNNPPGYKLFNSANGLDRLPLIRGSPSRQVFRLNVRTAAGSPLRFAIRQEPSKDHGVD